METPETKIDETQLMPEATAIPGEGKSDANISADTTDTPTQPQIITEAEFKTFSGLDDEKLTEDKKDEDGLLTERSNDFYDAYYTKSKRADMIYDLQTADTYWESRPEKKKEYEATYGDKAKEVFDQDYKKLEEVWRKTVENQTEVVAMNDRFKWLFGDDPNISYDNAAAFEAVTEIHNGSLKIDDLMTDKQQTDRQAAIGSKNILNDQGKIVTLADNEKWWKWSKGEGFEMNGDDPKYKSKDGRKIIGYEYPRLAADYRGPSYLIAKYEGDTATGEVVSVWDTTNIWAIGGGNKERETNIFRAIPRTAIKTTTGLAIDVVNTTMAIMGSVATLMDSDDDNAFVDWTNNQIMTGKKLRLSQTDYDASKIITPLNTLEFVSNVVAQLYAGKGIFTGVQKLSKAFLGSDKVLAAAKALEKEGKAVEALRKFSQYEMAGGKAARAASLIGMTMMNGTTVLDEARAAGFSEKESASIYLAFFGAMLGANTISNKMLDPFFTKAEMIPLMNQTIKESVAKVPKGATDKVMYKWAKNLVVTMADKAKTLPKLAGHTGKVADVGQSSFRLAVNSMMLKGASEAMEEEAEWFGEQAVKHAATIYSNVAYKGEKEIPVFDNIMNEGYFARQLPNIAMSAVGGFLGGAMMHVIPGFNHQTEESFLLKGTAAERLMKIPMLNGKHEELFLKQKQALFKSGAMGSHLLSIKVNDKTGEFYKMTDPEAKGTLSHAEAADRAITNQFLYYKTLYGGANKTYDAILQLDPTLRDELENAKGHVFHNELTKLHKQHKDLWDAIAGKDKPPIPAIKDVKKATETKKAEKVESTETTSKVVSEPDAETTEQKAKAEEAMDSEVATRAALLGTTNTLAVAELIKVEKEIDDILSGRAVAQQVLKSIVRNSKSEHIKAFMDKNQNAALRPDGSDSPYSKFETTLMELIFSADSNLAIDYNRKHADYIKEAEDLKNLITGDITEEAIQKLADKATANPKTVALDPFSNLKEVFDEKIVKKLDQIIPDAEFKELVAKARLDLGLDPAKDTKGYIAAIQAAFKAFMKVENNGVDIEEDPEAYVEDADEETKIDQRTRFIQQNGELIHNGALSNLIDILARNKKLFINAKVVNSPVVFTEVFAKEFPDSGNIRPGFDATQDIKMAETAKNKAEAEYMALADTAKDAITMTEKQILMYKLKEAMAKVNQTRSAYAATLTSQTLYGEFQDVLIGNGTELLFKLSHNAPAEELVPVVKADSPTTTKAKTFIANTKTIFDNISAYVPIVPELGAVYNLLNEITPNDMGVVSTPTKIINPTDSKTITTDAGTIINMEPSVYDELKVLREGSDSAEFRDIERARLVLDSVKIRLAQVELISESIAYLAVLQKYTRAHKPTGNIAYDTVPKFMSQYIFDPERLAYLKRKTVLSAEEQADLDQIESRLELLINFDNPASIHARLMKAKKRMEELIQIGEDSNKVPQMFRAYTYEMAKQFNVLRKGFEAELSKVDNEELIAALDAFYGITTAFTDSKEEELLLGGEKLAAVADALFKLPYSVKKEMVDRIGRDKMFILGSLTTDPKHFEFHYKQVLANNLNVSNMEEFKAPTYPQELMVRMIFNAITDDSGLLAGKFEDFKHLALVRGKGGTGKTAMIGIAIATAQAYQERKSKDWKGEDFNAGHQNRTIFASNYEDQYKELSKICIALGVNPATSSGYSKQALYKMLKEDGTDPMFSSITNIVFDEATFIQSSSSTDTIADTELGWFSNRIQEINAKRATLTGKDSLSPITLILVGDAKQGGFQEGMTVMFDGPADTVLDYKKLGSKVTPFTGPADNLIAQSDELEYVFRTRCPKTREIADKMRAIADEGFGGLFGGAAKTTKVSVSSGTISNDKERLRLGGTSAVRNINELYADSNPAIANIAMQLEYDKANDIVDPEKIFKIIICDNAITNAEQFIKDETKGALIRKLVKEHENNFMFRTTTNVQGAQADYIIADVQALFPTLPIRSDANSGDGMMLRVIAMIVDRSKYYACLNVGPDAAIETVNDAVITMLPDTDVKQLMNTWNTFYLTKFRNVKDIPAEPKITVTEQVETDIINSEKTGEVEEEKGEETKEAPTAPPVQPSVTTLGMPVIGPAIVLTPVSSEIKSAEEATKDTLAENIVEVVDVFNNIDTPMSKAIIEAVSKEPKKEEKDIAKAEAEYWSQLAEKGFVACYPNFEGDYKSDEVWYRINYASDIYGERRYKGSGYQVTEEARLASEAAMSAFRNMNTAQGNTRNDYIYSLVSYHSLKSGKDGSKQEDEIKHAIYARRADITDGTKYHVGTIHKDARKTLPALDAMLTEREKILDASLETMKSVAKAEPSWFPVGKKDGLGVAGTAMSSEIIAKLNSKKGAKNAEIPTFTGNTILGRTALSDETEKFKQNKMSDASKEVGQLFLESTIANTDKVFRVTTAGSPNRKSSKAQKALGELKDRGTYLSNLPSPGDSPSTTLLTAIRTAADKGKFTPEIIQKIDGRISFSPGGKQIVKTTVGSVDYFIITFNGYNGRKVSVAVSGIGAASTYKLIFGFDAKGNMISPDPKDNNYKSDIEAHGILEHLGNSKLSDENTVDITETMSVEEASKWLAAQHQYDLAEMRGFDSSAARLDRASREFMKNKAVTFDKVKITLEELTENLKDQGVQVSAPLVFTSTDGAKLDGKAFIYYTYHSTDKYDLSNKDTIQNLIRITSTKKAGNFSKELFDIESFTRDGVGILMLDTKSTSFEELMDSLTSSTSADLNRSSSPARSAANRNLVAFVKELAEILIKSEDRGLHQNLKTLGMHTTGANAGKPVVQIFSPEVKEAITKLLTTDPKVAGILYDVLVSNTSDAMMGTIAVDTKTENPKILKLFTLTDAEERLEYWNTELATDAEIAEELKVLGLNQDTIQNLHDHTVSGNVHLINNNPKVINTSSGAITYIKEDLLTAYGAKPLSGTTGVFNMVKFLVSLKNAAKGDIGLAKSAARVLDNIMTAYSNPGTLTHGIHWSGKLTTDYSADYGIASLDTEQSGKLYLSSAKSIDRPAVLTDFNKLIADVKLDKTTPTAYAAESMEMMQAKTDKKVREQINKYIADITKSTSVDEVTALQKTAAQYIEHELSLSKNLLTQETITIMKSDIKKATENRLMSLAVTMEAAKTAKLVEDTKKAFNEAPKVTNTLYKTPQVFDEIVKNTFDIDYQRFEYDPTAQDKKRKVTGKAEIIDYADRKIVVLNIGGKNIPFYLSTGQAGKKNVPAGKWYPIFGIGEDGWLNKTTEAEISAYYNSDILKGLSEALDRKFGDIRNSTLEPKVGLTGPHMDIINKNMVPVDHIDSSKGVVEKNVRDTIQHLNALFATDEDMVNDAMESLIEDLSMPEYSTPENKLILLTEARLLVQEGTYGTVKQNLITQIDNLMAEQQLLINQAQVAATPTPIESLKSVLQTNEVYKNNLSTEERGRIDNVVNFLAAQTFSKADMDAIATMNASLSNLPIDSSKAVDVAHAMTVLRVIAAEVSLTDSNMLMQLFKDIKKNNINCV